jgi:hypothetical protein
LLLDQFAKLAHTPTGCATSLSKSLVDEEKRDL